MLLIVMVGAAFFASAAASEVLAATNFNATSPLGHDPTGLAYLRETYNSPRGEAFGNSFAMIIVTELGDKTFFIAALLAMRNSRRAVFAGAALGLWLMTVLSAGIGLVLPTFLPKVYTHYAAVVLFAFFGTRQLYDCLQMVRRGEGQGASDELAEVESSLKEKEFRSRSAVAMQALTLTFLAEWGDRSQIATIALSAAKEAVGVTLGGIAGHSCCTCLAVVGGRVLATRISERAVLGAGGALFLAFAIHGVIVGPEA